MMHVWRHSLGILRASLLLMKVMLLLLLWMRTLVLMLLLRKGKRIRGGCSGPRVAVDVRLIHGSRNRMWFQHCQGGSQTQT